MNHLVRCKKVQQLDADLIGLGCDLSTSHFGSPLGVSDSCPPTFFYYYYYSNHILLLPVTHSQANITPCFPDTLSLEPECWNLDISYHTALEFSKIAVKGFLNEEQQEVLSCLSLMPCCSLPEEHLLFLMHLSPKLPSQACAQGH